MDLAAQYIKSAVKNVPSVFLMTDSQVAEEQFLVLINDLLASGEIPGLFGDDDLENIISSMRPQVKSLGMTDTREACWKFFIEKVRKQLKVALGLSSLPPVAWVSLPRVGTIWFPDHPGGWRDGSAVKSTDCSSRGPEFNSQQPHGGSQPSVMGTDALSSGVSQDSCSVLI